MEAVNSKGILEGQIKNLELKLATAKDQVRLVLAVVFQFEYLIICIIYID